MTPTDVPPPLQLLELIDGHWIAQAISTAAKLGLADQIAAGRKTADELARATGTHAPSLERLLRALASHGIFAEEDGAWRLTPKAEPLRSGPGSMRALASFLGEPWHRAAWASLIESIRTGKPAFDRVHGVPVFEFFRKSPEAGQSFNDAMTSLSGMEAESVVAAYDFSSIEGTLVDVGGGHGGLLAAILRAAPKLRGLLYELPHVAEGAKRTFEQAGVASRVEIATGDFLENVPAGDAYIMKHIIHDWDDERSTRILSNCRRSLRGKGKVLVVDAVIPAGNEPSHAKLLDLEMLVMTPGGRERTEAQLRDLLARSGLELTRVVPTRADACVVESVLA